MTASVRTLIITRCTCQKTSRRRFYFGITLLIICILRIPLAASQNADPPSLEYQIKSSLVFNFLKFIEWPETAAVDQFVLCHFSDDQHYRAPLSALQEEEVQGRRLRVEAVNMDNLNTCDIVVTSHNSDTVREALQQLANDNTVLTIGESENFIESGGIIRFVLVNDTVQFDINQAKATQVGLTISSKLLRLAQRVEQ